MPTALDQRPWSAHGTDWRLKWSPAAPHLTGTPSVVAAVERWLSREKTVRPTPTSSSVPSIPSEAMAVYSVLLVVAPTPFTTSAGAPSFESVPGRVYGPPAIP